MGDPEVFADYRDIIQKPMDLRKISKKIDEGSYMTYSCFESDMLLIFKNCERYNRLKNSEGILSLSNFGLKSFRKIWKAILVQGIDNGKHDKNSKKLKAEQPASKLFPESYNEDNTFESKKNEKSKEKHDTGDRRQLKIKKNREKDEDQLTSDGTVESVPDRSVKDSGKIFTKGKLEGATKEKTKGKERDQCKEKTQDQEKTWDDAKEKIREPLKEKVRDQAKEKSRGQREQGKEKARDQAKEKARDQAKDKARLEAEEVKQVKD